LILFVNNIRSFELFIDLGFIFLCINAWSDTTHRTTGRSSDISWNRGICF